MSGARDARWRLRADGLGVTTPDLSELEQSKHQEDCPFYRTFHSDDECEHGYGVCPACDPCTCERREDPIRLIAEINAWQRETFPDATAESFVAHLVEEVGELAEDPDGLGEIADCLLLLFGLCDKIDADPFVIMREKLEVNKRRTWGEPDESGVVRHVRTGDEHE